MRAWITAVLFAWDYRLHVWAAWLGDRLLAWAYRAEYVSPEERLLRVIQRGDGATLKFFDERTAVLLDLLMETRQAISELGTSPAAVAAATAALEAEAAAQVPEPLTTTQPLWLLSPDGQREYEVGWHRPDVPASLTQGGRTYHRRHVARPDGTWEFVR